MVYNIRHRNAGYRSFFLSGICTISSGVIISLLQSHYGFAYSMTGTLLAFMSIGNMLASFACGILPHKIGTRNTVLILCGGFFVGYLMTALSGFLPLLLAAFFLIGVAKGATINNCTVLVGENCENRAQGMSIMNAFYAFGALLCPILIRLFQRAGETAPLIGISVIGAVLWGNFLIAGLPGKKQASNADAGLKEYDFLKSRKFWLITALIFCQNAAETSVTGWLVTYYKDQNILSGAFSTYTVTVMWSATLIARLLIAFVFPLKDTFKSLTIMGIGCTLMYCLMITAGTPLAAIVMLFAFSFAIAGVYPIGIAGIGKTMSNSSIGVLIPIGSVGAIVMPWLIGLIADAAGLKTAMLTNLIPCAGIAILSALIRREK